MPTAQEFQLLGDQNIVVLCPSLADIGSVRFNMLALLVNKGMYGETTKYCLKRKDGRTIEFVYEGNKTVERGRTNTAFMTLNEFTKLVDGAMKRAGL